MPSDIKMLRWACLPEVENIPTGWRAVMFTEVSNVIAGQSPPSDTYNDRGEGLPFLQGNADFTEKHPVPALWCNKPLKTAKSGDTLISVRAPVGAVNRADRDYAIGRGLAALRALTNPNFLYHAIQRWRWSLQRVAQGTTFDAVTARHFAQLYVALPPPEEQVAIARILDAVDTTIERTRVALAKARNLRQGLLDDLLSIGVDRFGRLRDFQKADGFKHTVIGQIPIEWHLSTIQKEFNLQHGFTLNENRRPYHQERKYLRVANVQRDELKLEDVQELEADEAEFTSRMLEINDLLVVEGHADRMQIGRCALVTEVAVGMTFQNHLFRLRSQGQISPYFACLWLNSNYAQKYWNARCATSSGLNTINQRMLKSMLIPVLPKSEQETIQEIVQSQRRHIDSLTNKLARQTTLKKSLMHDLLTGRVRVNQSRVEQQLKLFEV